jgi:hypothetical protein
MKYLFVLIVVLLVGLSAQAGAKAALTLTNSHYKSLNNSCSAFASLAKEYGFEAIVLSPTFFYDRHANALISSFEEGVLGTCLNELTSLGMEVIYRPMFESMEAKYASSKSNFNSAGTCGERQAQVEQMHTNGQIWRAFLRIKPDSKMYQVLFREYLQWSAQAVESKFFRVVLTSEIFQSTNLEGAAWNQVLWNLRNDLNRLRPDTKNYIGVDPGALAPYHDMGAKEGQQKLSVDQCRNFQNLLWSADFFPLSVYGDLTLGKNKTVTPLQNLIPTVIVHILENLSDGKRCPLPQSLKEKLYSKAIVSETGFGGDMRQSWNSKGSGFQNPRVRKAFLVWFKDLIAHAAQLRLEPWKYVGIWNTGDFDFIGFGGCSSLADPNSLPAIPHYSKIPELSAVRDILYSFGPTWLQAKPRELPMLPAAQLPTEILTTPLSLEYSPESPESDPNPKF